jgi:hypothetical protein
MSTVRIQVRRGTASEWTTANPVLAAGEMGVETNTNLFKFGNGTATWTALAYANNSDVAIGEISQDAINTALTMGAGLTKTYNDGANTITITVDTDVVSTKTFATSEANTKAANAKSEAIAAAASDATTKANAAQAAAISAAEDYTDTAVSGLNSSLSGYLETGDRGTAGGVASLDSNTKILQSELPLGSLTTDISTTGDLFAKDVTISGNLAVNGTMTTINTENFAIEDTMLLMAKANQSGMLDLGFVAGHNTGTFNHTGFVRDASEDKWKLFKGVTTEPTTTVDFTQGSLDAIAVGRLESTESVLNNPTLTGTIVLPNGSIVAANLAENAVTAAKIADNSITAAKISDNAVGESEIAPNAVTTAKIALNAVTAEKIAANSISQSHLSDDSVGTNEIGGLAVTTEKIAEDAVTSSKIATNAVTEAKIAALSVSNGKIADSAVSTAKIADSSVTAAKVAANSINTVNIINGAITSDKITNETIVNADISPTAAIAQSKIDGLGASLTALAPLDGPTFTGTVVLPSTTSIGNLSSTELGYLDGISSSVQSQFGSAATALSNHESDTTNIHGIADTSLLATTANVATAKSEAITAAGTAADTKVSTAVAALTKSSVGLANVNNTADSAKPVSTAQASAIATAKSEAIADATAQVNAVIASAPAALNTLDELAAALGDDANFASTVTTGLAAKAPIASPTFTGTVTVAAAGVAFTDKVQTRAGVPSLTTIATAVSSNSTLDALGTDAAVRDSLVPLSGAVNVSFEATGNAKYAIGSSINFYQSSGTGANITGSGVTILATPGATLRTTNSSVTATKVAATTWLLAGDLKA